MQKLQFLLSEHMNYDTIQGRQEILSRQKGTIKDALTVDMNCLYSNNSLDILITKL
jgi:hypothetical protein